MRSFVAIELTPALREPLVRLLAKLPRSRAVRWCTPEQLHVTLKFLGEVDEARLPQVCRIVSEVSSALGAFEMRLSGLGCFPSPRQPRVLWCGIEDLTRGCARWVEAADPRFEELGFERENRAFTPHVTLGRSRSAAGSAVLRSVLAQPVDLPPAVMTARRVILFESRLLPQGAHYRAVHQAPLAGPDLDNAECGG